MTKEELKSYLKSMFESKNKFADIHGTSSLMDAKYMLIADALSEDTALLADAIEEEFNKNIIYNRDINKRVSYISQ